MDIQEIIFLTGEKDSGKSDAEREVKNDGLNDNQGSAKRFEARLTSNGLVEVRVEI